MAIGLLLVCVAYRLAREARDRLIGEAVDADLSDRIGDFLSSQDEIDKVAALLTMRLGLDSVLVAARVDLTPGIDSEEVELACVRLKRRIADKWPQVEHVFLDITEAPGPSEDPPSPADPGLSRFELTEPDGVAVRRGEPRNRQGDRSATRPETA